MPVFPSVNEQMDLIKRGVEEIIPEEELVKKIERSIKTKKPLIIKEGFDPTAPDLHIGHMVSIRKLKHFQDLGHRIIFLIGDFTGLVGDPSGRSEIRKMMSQEEIEKNAQTYKDQVFKVLDPSKTEVRFNSEWLGKLSILDFLQLSSCHTVARMLERDDFSKRYSEGRDISILEFIYCLLQAYDSVALRSDVEVGGTDQKFNLLTGRTIMRRYNIEPQVILTMPLLIGTNGVEKMSKSLGNYIGIQDAPQEIYGKTLSIDDSMIYPYFMLATEISKTELEKIKRDLEDLDVNPRDLKRRLAREIVSLYYGEKEASEAEKEFDRIFKAKKLPSDIPEKEIELGEWKVVELLVVSGLCSSNSEARRLIQQGGVRIDGEQVKEISSITEAVSGMILNVGKRKFVKVKAKE